MNRQPSLPQPAPPIGVTELSDCEREPIHVPGSIQPHGVLLSIDPTTLEIVQLAGDTERLVGLSPRDVLGRHAETIFARAELDRLSSSASQDGTFFLELPLEGRASQLYATVHLSEGVLVLELEPADSIVTPLALVQSMITRVQGSAEPGGFLQEVAQEVREGTGFDRVMVYQFQPDDSGEVIAEAKGIGLEPYLGLRYPASDIPRQARDLYLRNRIRLIPDAHYIPAPISPALNPLTGKPLDLTQSTLRSVSPVHLEYLHNMGVAASMSLSIVIEGKLWGLIACHHGAARYLGQPIRLACDLFAQMISLQLGEKLATKAAGERLRLRQTHASLVETMVSKQPLGEALIGSHPNLMDYIPAGGVVVWWEGKATRLGLTPSDEQLEPLLDWLSTSVPEGVFATDCLSSSYPQAEAFAGVASGLLAISVSRTPRDYMLWFRPEVAQTVTWAGNPSKPVEVTAEGARPSPRKSFGAWKEIVKGHSRPWGALIEEAASALRVSILDFVLRHQDNLMREREKVRQQQNFLMAELDHRVKNTIATIQALVRYSSAGAAEPFVQSIQERLQAMARTHGLLTQHRWEGVDLRNLVMEQTAPFGDRITVEGPRMVLRPKAALSVSLALHELITNAAKHGGLSVAGGRVKIAWSEQSREDERWLALRWVEEGGPPVAPPTRTGFGRVLLERSLAYDIDGDVDLDFRSDGLVCTAMISFDHIDEGADLR
jgi:two-component system, chemotaxis family, sensor kinase Cph1